ncbi:MAG: hypothetical protein ACSHWZ_18875 [Sulfitobacter sp.]
MSKHYFNGLFAPATGETSPQSPAALMFERLVGDMQSTLQEEVWFDDSDWPGGFDWQCSVDAVWEGLAEDASLLAKLCTRNTGGRLLCRGAGLIARAIRADTPLELDAVLSRFAVVLQAPAPSNVRFMLEEAQVCLQQMLDLARGNDSASNFGLPPAA